MAAAEEQLKRRSVDMPNGVQMSGSEHGAAGLFDLETQCLLNVFSLLPAKDLAAVACVHPQWRDIVSQDSWWRRFCSDEYGLTSPTCPLGQELGSFRACYSTWFLQFKQYAKLAGRARRCWNALEGWTQGHLPAIRSSLRPGASEAELDAAEQRLGVKLPPALRCLYRMHDGQELSIDRLLDQNHPVPFDPSIFHGLFGGYSFYNHMVSTRMLPLQRMLHWTTVFHSSVLLQAETRSEEHKQPNRRVMFAASYNFNKMVFVDTETGSVIVRQEDKVSFFDAAPADPEPGARDGVLRWLEEYARRLSSGELAAGSLVDELTEPMPRSSLSISLFPALPPQQAVAVTRGVCVRASPLFVPELSFRACAGAEAQQPATRYFFSYSISFSLLPEEQQREQWRGPPGQFRPLQSVQLLSRHWVVRDGNGEVENEMRGEAVVGHYPLLKPDGREFRYQSCTHQAYPRGSMEGDFTFVEGSIRRPTGPQFEVECPRFMLTVPDYIF